jgi:hypothetical protein
LSFVVLQSHCGFLKPWSFLVAWKTKGNSSHWHDNEAQIQKKIHERILRTKEGKLSIQYFDGTTMEAYQRPNRAWETVYCRNKEMPKECVPLDVITTGKVNTTAFANDLQRLDDLQQLDELVKVGDGLGVSEMPDSVPLSQPARPNTNISTPVSPVRDRRSSLLLSSRTIYVTNG